MSAVKRNLLYTLIVITLLSANTVFALTENEAKLLSRQAYKKALNANLHQCTLSMLFPLFPHLYQTG